MTEGSGNVFADLGLADADELLAKADMLHEMSRLIESQRLSAAHASAMLGISEGRLSAMLRGKLLGPISIELLTIYLERLRRQI